MLLCGAAREVITPPQQALPIHGMFGIATSSLDDQFVRTIALKTDTDLFLMISFDLGGAPEGGTWGEELANKYNVPRKNILYFSTHAHATVTIDPGISSAASEEEKEKLEIIKKQYHDGLFSSVEKAVSSVRPCKIGIGKGKSYININRNQIFKKIDENGLTGEEYCMLGWNPKGPSDKTVDEIRFEDEYGNPIAFFINYSVHNVGMHTNTMGIDGGLALSSDIGGLCSQYMEAQFPGTIAMWSSGAAGDQNPIMMASLYKVDERTGEWASVSMGNAAYDMTKTLASLHYADILEINDKIVCEMSDVNVSAAIGVASTPAYSFIPPDRGAKNYTTERGFLKKFDFNRPVSEAETYDINMQLLKVGNLAFVGICGELYTNIGQILKNVSPEEHTIIVMHDRLANDRGAGYIHDEEGSHCGGNGGWGRDRSLQVPGYVNAAMSSTLLEMFDETGRFSSQGEK